MTECDLSSTLFEIAKKDLGAAEVLYSTGYYPQAVFYLEQAVEKGTKSVAVEVGAVKPSEGDLKSIGHYSYRVYERAWSIFKTWFRGMEFVETMVSIPIAKSSTRQYLLSLDPDKIFESWNSKVGELRKIAFDENELRQYMVVLQLLFTLARTFTVSKDVNVGFLGYLKKYPENVEKQLEFYLSTKFGGTLLKESGVSKEQAIKLIRGFVTSLTPEELEPLREFGEQLVRFGMLFTLLIYLSLLLTPHVNSSRYPEEGYGPHSYTKNTPIVQRFSELIELVSGSFEVLESFFDKKR